MRTAPRSIRPWRRFKWQARMWLAEQGLNFWWWLAGEHVPLTTLGAFREFTTTLPDEPEQPYRTVTEDELLAALQRDYPR